VCVVQAFFSIDPSEERQIEGRSARAGARGQYMQVLLQKQLIDELKVIAQQLESKREGNGMYEFLASEREKLHNETARKLVESVQGALHPHKLTYQLKKVLERLSR